MAERLTTNQEVPGSTPGWIVMYLFAFFDVENQFDAMNASPLLIFLNIFLSCADVSHAACDVLLLEFIPAVGCLCQALESEQMGWIRALNSEDVGFFLQSLVPARHPLHQTKIPQN